MYAFIADPRSDHYAYVYQHQDDGWHYLAVLNTDSREITFTPAGSDLGPDGLPTPRTIDADTDLMPQLGRISLAIEWQRGRERLQDLHSPLAMI